MSEAPERMWIDPDILPPEWHKRYYCDVEYIRGDLIHKAVNEKVADIGNMVLRLAEENDTSTQSGAQRFDALFHAVSRIHAMRSDEA